MSVLSRALFIRSLSRTQDGIMKVDIASATRALQSEPDRLISRPFRTPPGWFKSLTDCAARPGPRPNFWSDEFPIQKGISVRRSGGGHG